jgi:hypothetical protein
MLGGTATVSSGGVGLSSLHPLALFALHVAGGAAAAFARGSITNGAVSPATSDKASTMAAGREARIVWRVMDMAESP